MRALGPIAALAFALVGCAGPNVAREGADPTTPPAPRPGACHPDVVAWTERCSDRGASVTASACPTANLFVVTANGLRVELARDPQRGFQRAVLRARGLCDRSIAEACSQNSSVLSSTRRRDQTHGARLGFADLNLTPKLRLVGGVRIEDAAINEAARHMRVYRHSTIMQLVRWALLRPVHALLVRLGIHPSSVAMMVYGGRGGFVRHLRRVAGANEL